MATTTSITPAALNTVEAARYVGISERYLRQLVAAGKLSRAKIGTKPLYRRVDLDELLERSLIVRQPA